VTAGNQLGLGNGLVVDNTFATMPAFAKAHMSTIGIRHGITSHGAARTADWSTGTRSYPLMLANAMGGSAAIKAAVLGTTMPDGPRPPEGSVTLQTIASPQVFKGATRNGIKSQAWAQPADAAFQFTPAK